MFEVITPLRLVLDLYCGNFVLGKWVVDRFRTVATNFAKGHGDSEYCAYLLGDSKAAKHPKTEPQLTVRCMYFPEQSGTNDTCWDSGDGEKLATLASENSWHCEEQSQHRRHFPD